MIEELRSLPGGAPSLAVIGIGLVAFVASLLFMHSGIASWDERLFVSLNKGTGSETLVARTVSVATTPIALVILILVAALVVHRSQGAGAVVVSVTAAALGWALANAAKLFIDRPRPYATLSEAILRQDPARGTSFPSSHTAIVCAVVLALMPLLPRPWRFVGVGVVVLVAWSRLYFGVHHPLDLLGGVGVGLVSAGLAWSILGAIARF